MKPETIIKKGSEYEHQCALFAWAALNKNVYPELEMMFAIKNEEKSGSAIVGSRFKASGVKKGVPDIFLPVPMKNFNGLFIEMKKPGGKASTAQLEFGTKLQYQGYAFAICDSWEKAKDILLQYLRK